MESGYSQRKRISYNHVDTHYVQAVPFFEAMALITLGCSAASVLATTLDR